MFGPQGILNDYNLQRTFNLLKLHFEYQGQLVTQSIRPYIPKIAQAEQRYTDQLEKFLQKRQTFINQVLEG